jgi:hypothetical protein
MKYRRKTMCCWPFVVDHLLLTICCWPFAVGYLLVVDYLLLTMCCCSIQQILLTIRAGLSNSSSSAIPSHSRCIRSNSKGKGVRVSM